jgi:hypothetical protein
VLEGWVESGRPLPPWARLALRQSFGQLLAVLQWMQRPDTGGLSGTRPKETDHE